MAASLMRVSSLNPNGSFNLEYILAYTLFFLIFPYVATHCILALRMAGNRSAERGLLKPATVFSCITCYNLDPFVFMTA